MPAKLLCLILTFLYLLYLYIFLPNLNKVIIIIIYFEIVLSKIVCVKIAKCCLNCIFGQREKISFVCLFLLDLFGCCCCFFLFFSVFIFFFIYFFFCCFLFLFFLFYFEICQYQTLVPYAINQ